MKELSPEVWEHRGYIVTKNLTPGQSLYGEKILREYGDEYRIWDPKKSKAAAALRNGAKFFPLAKGLKILYLGVGTGRTASHFSDVVGDEGLIIGIDLGYLPLQRVLDISETRENVVPILADARRPKIYEESIPGKVDVIYQDLAQFDQTEILLRNAKKFLKRKGFIIYMVKARSIRSYDDPKKVFKTELKKLEKANFKILDTVDLNPYSKDHIAIIAQK
jgi:fibrillarin-like pre-rRNA processing protein